MLDLTITDSIATVVLRRPPVNAFNVSMVELLDAAIDDAHEAGVRCLQVRAENPGVFSAGADIAMLRAATDRQGGVDALVAFAGRFQRALDKLESVPFVTIAAIDGIALGGGFELALACDFRLAGPGARMGLTETTLGLVPGAGGTQRLAAVLGRARARQLVLSGRILDADEADRMGLADKHPGGAADAARTLADELSARPARALALAKECLVEAPSVAGYARELSASRELYENPETVALLNRFLDRKRKDTR